MKTKLIVGAVVTLVLTLALGIVVVAMSGANASAREQAARVAACSHVSPAAGRGACVEGRPVIETRVLRRVHVIYRDRRYTVDGLINKCYHLVARDVNDQVKLINSGNGVPGNSDPSLAGGFGQCLAGIAAFTGPGNNDPALPTN